MFLTRDVNVRSPSTPSKTLRRNSKLRRKITHSLHDHQLKFIEAHIKCLSTQKDTQISKFASTALLQPWEIKRILVDVCKSIIRKSTAPQIHTYGASTSNLLQMV